ncbi:hypothetical protein PG991_009381 [Apiospora marii]|uniref:Uncharacterized protein n=1 Tax=Apiospora marii TaxID=335849 RepID=A0ABR1RKS0_9PEZI
MFCCGRSCSKEGPSGPPDFDPSPQSSSGPPVGVKMVAYGEIDRSENPPAYSRSEASPSTLKLLETFQEAAGQAAFQPLLHRDIHIWLDDKPNLHRPTKHGIKLLALLLLSLGKAHDSSMEFFFTRQRNPNADDLSTADKEKAKELDDLFNTRNWTQAVLSVDDSINLRDLGLQAHIKRLEETCAQDSEPHIRLLDVVREKKVPFWYGYHQRDISTNELQRLYDNALKETKKQPKLLNSVRFTMSREISYHERLRLQASGRLTTVLILTGSPLANSEVDGLKQDLNKIQGASEFSIEALAFCEFMDPNG